MCVPPLRCLFVETGSSRYILHVMILPGPVQEVLEEAMWTQEQKEGKSFEETKISQMPSLYLNKNVTPCVVTSNYDFLCLLISLKYYLEVKE